MSLDSERRNEEIWISRQLGMTFRALGKKYDITPERVRQIFKRRERQAIVYANKAAPDYTDAFGLKRWLPPIAAMHQLEKIGTLYELLNSYCIKPESMAYSSPVG